MLCVDNLVIFVFFICNQYDVIVFCLYNGIGYCFSVVFYYFDLFGVQYFGQNIVDNGVWFFGMWVIVSYYDDICEFFGNGFYEWVFIFVMIFVIVKDVL